MARLGWIGMAPPINPEPPPKGTSAIFSALANDAAHLFRRLRFDGAEWRVQLGMMVRVHATLAERIRGKLVEHGGIRDNPCRIDYLRKFAGNVAHGVRVYYRNLIESISQSWRARK